MGLWSVNYRRVGLRSVNSRCVNSRCVNCRSVNCRSVRPRSVSSQRVGSRSGASWSVRASQGLESSRNWNEIYIKVYWNGRQGGVSVVPCRLLGFPAVSFSGLIYYWWQRCIHSNAVYLSLCSNSFPVNKLNYAVQTSYRGTFFNKLLLQIWMGVPYSYMSNVWYIRWIYSPVPTSLFQHFISP